MTWLWWAIPLILSIFLWSINECLLGRFKEMVAGVLAFIAFALVATAFVVSGWKVGIGAFVGIFVLASLLRPIALAISRRLVRYPDLGFNNYAARRLRQHAKDFGSEAHFQRFEKENRAGERHKSEAISSATRIPSIAELLTRLNAAERDLAALYDMTEVQILPPHVRKAVLHNPHLVAFFLENSEPSSSSDGTYFRKYCMDTHIRLKIWTQCNPGGSEP